MKINRLPERRRYWSTEDIGPFKAPGYGQYMPRKRFEDIISSFLESPDDNLTEGEENLFKG